MRIHFFSDPHNKHEKINFSSADILICCGDITAKGSLKDLEKFLKYISKLDYKNKIIIAGNHDFCFENEDKKKAEELVLENGIIYLNEAEIKINNVKIFGSPIQPWFHDWAFNRTRGEEIKRSWDLIPIDTDILVTHGPPFGILDKCYHGERVGCLDLYNRVLEVRPKIHAFGHIHEDYGYLERNGVQFVNCSSYNHKTKAINPIIELEFFK